MLQTQKEVSRLVLVLVLVLLPTQYSTWTWTWTWWHTNDADDADDRVGSRVQWWQVNAKSSSGVTQVTVLGTRAFGARTHPTVRAAAEREHNSRFLAVEIRNEQHNPLNQSPTLETPRSEQSIQPLVGHKAHHHHHHCSHK